MIPPLPATAVGRRPYFGPTATALAVVTLVLGLAAGCSSGGGEPATEAGGEGRGPLTGRAGFTIERFDPTGPGKVTGAEDARRGIADLLDHYLAVATLEPLASGHPVTDAADVLAPSTLAALDPPGRAALYDEGLPVARRVSVDRAAATVDALAGTDGSVGLAVARLDVAVSADLGATTLTIARTGELVLEPVEGRWRVTSFDLEVTRDTPEAATTTSRAGAGAA